MLRWELLDWSGIFPSSYLVLLTSCIFINKYAHLEEMHKMETAISVPDAKLELWVWIGHFPSKYWGVSQYEYDSPVRWPWGGSSSGMVWGREICPVLLHVFGVGQVFGVDLLGYIFWWHLEGLSRWNLGSLEGKKDYYYVTEIPDSLLCFSDLYYYSSLFLLHWNYALFQGGIRIVSFTDLVLLVSGMSMPLTSWRHWDSKNTTNLFEEVWYKSFVFLLIPTSYLMDSCKT